MDELNWMWGLAILLIPLGVMGIALLVTGEF